MYGLSHGQTSNDQESYHNGCSLVKHIAAEGTQANAS